MRLIDADALKEAIRKVLCIKSLALLVPSEKAIVNQIDLAPTVNGWISVKDKLPDKEGQYLCWFGKNTVTKGAEIATYLKMWKAFGSLISLKTYPNVTHWMPIEPPEEDMITCFKCGKILPGTLRPGEYVMCKECEEKWTKLEETINRDVIEKMRDDVMKIKPFGWMFIPKMKDATTISVEHRPIVLCQDCKQWDEDGSQMGRGWCGWHMKSTGPRFFCADGEKEEDDAAEG